MDSSVIKLNVSANKPGTTIAIKLDSVTVWESTAGTNVQTPEFPVEETDNSVEHLLEIILSGKKMEDTIVGQDGNIVDDLLVKIENITIDDINIDQLVYKLAKYTHNFNGHGEVIDGQFFGPMGCNGVVSFNFSSPVYMWLLENL